MKKKRKMLQPKVTVLMSVYNGEDFLAEAIESILGQSFKDFEFLIVNDGSKDNSSEIVSQFVHKDRRIRLIDQSNKGLVAALNLGLKEARGALIARIDADDIAYPSRLEKQVAHMTRNPKIVASGSSITLIDTQGQIMRQIKYPVTTDKVRKQMMKGSKLAHPAVMMRRAVVLRVGAYREVCRPADDYDLWLRLLEVGEIDNLQEPLLYHRQHDNKMSNTEWFSMRIATECAKFSYQMRNGGKADPLDSMEFPLSIGKLKDFDIPQYQLSELYCSTFIKLVKQKRSFTASEMNSVEFLAKWIIGQPSLFLRIKILKALFRYTRKRFAYSQGS
ncbi:glycosyltransferase [Opitutales bacterium]|nr:glycosyltransferase [Opitutales bacterium]